MFLSSPGVYSLCIDNVFERFGYKVVFVQLVTLVMQDWLKYQTEYDKVKVLADNFTVSPEYTDTCPGHFLVDRPSLEYTEACPGDVLMDRSSLEYTDTCPGDVLMKRSGLEYTETVLETFSWTGLV